MKNIESFGKIYYRLNSVMMRFWLTNVRFNKNRIQASYRNLPMDTTVTDSRWRNPLQTLNPTGFDWGRISAMFMDKSQTHLSRKVRGRNFMQIIVQNSISYSWLMQFKDMSETILNQDQIEMDPKKRRTEVNSGCSKYEDGSDDFDY